MIKNNKILIKGGRVIDPANDLDTVSDILIEAGKISKVGQNLACEGAKKIDALGQIVIPGIVDMHVHLREPGREDKETVSSGTRAALKGGVTSLLAMPNTFPAIDSVQNLCSLKNIIEEAAQANVLITASITKARLGKELTDIIKLREAGAIAISDDGSSVESEALMLEALKISGKENFLVIAHCEDKKLYANGVVNSGLTATRMGLKGISRESEYKRIERDIDLAEQAGARIHIAHLSCAESVAIIAKAKKKGVQVTCEVAPHHFALDEEAVLGYDANMKMNPPLRSKEDVAALRKGLADGTIDAIASDHAPHTENEKAIEFERAEFGVIGLETELAIGISELVEKKVLDWPELVRKISLNPAKILGLAKGNLKSGNDADLVIISPKEWVVEKSGLFSKSRNCAFLGKKLKGLVEYTIYAGKIAYQRS